MGYLGGFLVTIKQHGRKNRVTTQYSGGRLFRRKKRNADLRTAVVLGVAGIVSAYIAGNISVGMSESLSNVLFSILLLVVAARMLYDLAIARRTPAPAA